MGVMVPNGVLLGRERTPAQPALANKFASYGIPPPSRGREKTQAITASANSLSALPISARSSWFQGWKPGMK